MAHGQHTTLFYYAWCSGVVSYTHTHRQTNKKILCARSSSRQYPPVSCQYEWKKNAYNLLTLFLTKPASFNKPSNGPCCFFFLI